MSECVLLALLVPSLPCRASTNGKSRKHIACSDISPSLSWIKYSPFANITREGLFGRFPARISLLSVRPSVCLQVGNASATSAFLHNSLVLPYRICLSLSLLPHVPVRLYSFLSCRLFSCMCVEPPLSLTLALSRSFLFLSPSRSLTLLLRPQRLHIFCHLSPSSFSTLKLYLSSVMQSSNSPKIGAE